MPYLVLGIALLVGLVLLAKGFAGADPRTLARIVKWSGGVLGVAVLVLLVVTGRFGIAVWASMLLLPLILRWRQFQNMARGWRGPSAGQTSEVETTFLRMTLDHDTGELSGTVLEGAYRGRRLEELGMHELVELLRECRIHDEQGAAILETYLDRVWSGEWRGDRQGAGAGGYDGGAGAGGGYHGGYHGGAGAGAGHGRRAGGASGGMTREEAYQVLGLQPGATPEQIKEAHRRLMLSYHPDHGGSTYLAAKINEAKDLLLKW